MKDDKVSFKIRVAEEYVKDIKHDFRTGYVGAAIRKAEALKEAADAIILEVRAAIERHA